MELGYNWFYRPRLDYELKRYEALAFEQYLNKCLDNQIVYSPLKEVNLQLTTIGAFLNEVHADKYLWQKNIKSVDVAQVALEFNAIKDESLNELERICNFLLKKITPFKDQFERLKKKAQEDIEVMPVGVCPVYWNEGWLLCKNRMKVDVFLYKHKMVLDNNGDDAFETQYYKTFDYAYSNSPGEIKQILLRECSAYPNPATYFVNSVSTYSLEETVLPIAVEKVVQLNQL